MKPDARRPTHPGRILFRHYLEPRKISISAFADAVEVSRKHMSKIVNGHADVEATLAVKMAKVLNTSTRFWMNLQSAVETFDAEQAAKKWKPKMAYSRMSAAPGSEFDAAD